MQLARFIQEVKQEAGKVTWPSRKETAMSFIMVMIMVVVASVFFLAADALISLLIKFILGF